MRQQGTTEDQVAIQSFGVMGLKEHWELIPLQVLVGLGCRNPLFSLCGTRQVLSGVLSSLHPTPMDRAAKGALHTEIHLLGS